jgi:hypothetical protein
MVAVEIEETEAAADAIAGSFLSSTSQKVATGRVAIFSGCKSSYALSLLFSDLMAGA